MSSSSLLAPQSEICFTCLWRKVQKRKNKTWEGDGILTIRGSNCVIKSREDGSQVATGQWPAGRECTPGQIYMIGGKEIDEQISLRDLEKESSQTQLHIPAPCLTQPSKYTSKVDLKSKPPMRSHNSTQALNLTQAHTSKFFAKPTIDRPFNVPSRTIISDSKRTRPDSLTQSEVDDKMLEQGPKRVKQSSVKSVEEVSETSTDLLQAREDQAYVCLYRKLKASNSSKNQTWDGDGILHVVGSQRGQMAVLKDSSNQKVLGSMLLGLKLNLQKGAIVKVGSREVEIQTPITEGELVELERTSDNSTETDWAQVVKQNGISVGFKDPVINKRPSVNKPKFDPQAEGALVLTKPSAAWLLKHGIQNDKIVDVVVDPSIAQSLRPHQVDGLKFMYECTMGLREVGGNGCILADEMGLGKSIQAISLLWTLLRQNPVAGKGPVISRAMIVCPVTLVKNWKREIYKWLGRSRLNVFTADGKSDIKQFTCSLYYNVLVIGYEKLRTLSKELNAIYPPIGLIIADEGHRLRSIEAKTTQALRSLKTKRRVVLSGTPIQNNLTEYYAMIDFVNPGILEDYRSFKKKFEQPILKSREPCCDAKQKMHGEAQAEELARMSRNYVLRRGSEVIKEHLPPRHDYCVFIKPTAVQRRIYEAILDSPEIRAVFSGDTSQHLVLINILKQLCNSPGLLMNEHSIKTLEQNSSKLFPAWVTRDDVQLSGKLVALSQFLSILRKKDEEKIIIVSNFTKTLDIVETFCKASKYTFCRLDGKTQQNQRDDIVQIFNRSSARAQFIFLLSSKSGGVGLNLIGASRLVLLDGDWNPATDLQAMARIWRQGQQKTCHIYRFLTTGTIDECIFQRQVTKIGLATDLMNDHKIGEEAQGGGNTFTKSELRRLFELHADTNCYTHDLLECQCLDVKSVTEPEEWIDEEEQLEATSALGSGYESDASLPDLDLVGFLPASKFKKIPRKDDVLKIKRTLVELEKWSHLNATDLKSLDELDDEILKETISTLNPQVSELQDSSQDDQTNQPGGIISFVFTRSNG